MNLIKLKDSSGNEVHINPDHVLFVASSKMVGRSAVFLTGGVTLETHGTAVEVRNTLSDTLLLDA